MVRQTRISVVTHHADGKEYTRHEVYKKNEDDNKKGELYIEWYSPTGVKVTSPTEFLILEGIYTNDISYVSVEINEITNEIRQIANAQREK